jgi:DNA mismatch repair protein MutS2
LEQDLSTFTSHLQRLRAALEDSRTPKLVLLDEIGSSTDPAEGSAIARAALLELQQQGALGIATTHQGTLKVFAHETPGIFNGSMEFDQETLRPTFKFRSGLPGSSYALEISARVGLPPKIIASARVFMGVEKNRLEDLLSRLNESLRLSESSRREAELKRVEMESLRKLYSERMRELSRLEKDRLQKAAQEAKEILERANQRIEAEVKAIREQKASRSSIVNAHQAIRREKDKVQAILSSSEELSAEEAKGAAAVPVSFQIGDWVKIADLKNAVQILALKKDGQEALLEVGGLHIWMESSKLKAAQTPIQKKEGTAVKISLAEQPQISYELDLRGMTSDEAAFAVEKYLDDCAMSGWKSVRIIHGKGTGALRTRVREVLSRNPMVKSVRYGRPEEGEFGVTVVELG